MIKVTDDPQRNAVIVELMGKIGIPDAEAFYAELRKVVPLHKPGFRMLTDLSAVETADFEMKSTIRKIMDYCNAMGVSQVVRVVTDPAQDIGFGIMALFHYSKDVKSQTLSSRGEAEALLSAS